MSTTTDATTVRSISCKHVSSQKPISLSAAKRSIVAKNDSSAMVSDKNINTAIQISRSVKEPTPGIEAVGALPPTVHHYFIEPSTTQKTEESYSAKQIVRPKRSRNKKKKFSDDSTTSCNSVKQKTLYSPVKRHCGLLNLGCVRQKHSNSRKIQLCGEVFLAFWNQNTVWSALRIHFVLNSRYYSGNRRFF